jgi:hypothetical protein
VTLCVLHVYRIAFIRYDQSETRKNCFRYLKLTCMSPLNAAICTTISYTLWVEWYYFKKIYLTLRSKVKVPRRSLRYVAHRLMVMHPHTKYHWPTCISKDKNVMARTRKYYLKNNYLTLRSKVITVCDTLPYGHAPTYEVQISFTYLERQTSYGPDKLRWEEAEEKID